MVGVKETTTLGGAKFFLLLILMNDTTNRFAPSNGSSFSENRVIQIDVPSGSSRFAALSESYLTFDIIASGSGGTAQLLPATGAYSVIRNFRTIINGQLVDEIAGANILANTWLQYSRSDNGISDWRDFQSATNDDDNTSVTRCIVNPSVLSGLWSKNSSFPMGLVDSFRIEIELDTANVALTGITSAAAFTLSNCYLVVKEKKIPASELDAYTAYLQDQFSSAGVMLNYIAYQRSLNSVGSSQTAPTIDFQGAAAHEACVALLTIPVDEAAYQTINNDEKLKGVRDGCQNYQWSIDGNLTPKQRVSTAKPMPQVAASELAAAFRGVNKRLRDYETVGDADNLVVGRNLAGRGRSMDLRGKQVQLNMNLSSPSASKTMYNYCGFIRTLVLKRGSLEIRD